MKGAPRSLVRRAVALTDGRVGDLAEVWLDWEARGVVRWDEGGWQATDREDLSLANAADALGSRLGRRLPDDSARLDTARDLLTCGALEGRVFTAEAVATTMEMDRDDVIDLLDELVAEDDPGTGVLVDLGPVEIDDLLREQSRHLWRYRFVRALDWRAARRAISGAVEQETAGRLAMALQEAFGPEQLRIAHVLAGLCRLAGDTEGAAQCRSLAQVGASRIALRSKGRHLLTVSTEGWAPHDYVDAAKLLLDACRTLDGGDPPSEMLPLAERAEELARQVTPRTDAGTLARSLFFQGRFQANLGNTDTAKRLLEAARKGGLDGSPLIVAASLSELGHVEARIGADLDAARTFVQRALVIVQRVRHAHGEAGCLYRLAAIELKAGDYDVARVRNGEATRLFEQLDDADGLASSLHQLGLIEDGAGNYKEARANTLAALEYKRTVAAVHDEAACLRLLGSIEHSLENNELARSHARAALALQRRIEDPDGEAASLALLGSIAQAAGDPDEARTRLRQAAEIYHRIGDGRQEAICRDALADLE